MTEPAVKPLAHITDADGNGPGRPAQMQGTAGAAESGRDAPGGPAAGGRTAGGKEAGRSGPPPGRQVQRAEGSGTGESGREKPGAPRASATPATAPPAASPGGGSGSAGREGALPQKPVRKKPAQKDPAPQKPAQKNPARQKPAQQKPTAQKPVAKKPAQQKPAPVQVIEVAPMAGRARSRRRHWGILLSFLILVVLPSVLVGWYMYAIADDQYESRVGFSVRAAEEQSTLDALSGLSGLIGASTSSSSDPDILYEFIRSREMIERVNARMDLRKVFTRPWFDPVFSLPDDASIEDLEDFWQRMVRVYYDGGTKLIEVRAYAFAPEEAHRLAQLVFEEAEAKINELSSVARADATRYAREELDKAIDRLIGARQAMTEFRIRTQIVDPQADIAGQMGLLNSLQAKLAEALIEKDLLELTAREGDPRLAKLAREIKVIEERIAEERRKLGVGGPDAAANGNPEEGYAKVIGEYERLQVELKFAETAYLNALGAYDAALAEAQRTSRYLTAYLDPTRPETSTAPNRPLLTALFAGFLFISWFILVLVYYSFRDRR